MSENLILKSGTEAVNYLQRRGYSVGKSKFYQDIKRGLVKRQADKSFLSGDLDSYARRNGLSRPELGGSNPVKVEELHEVKLKKEIEKLEWENKKREFEYQRELGKYIPRELLELELASRAAVLDSQLRTKIRARAKDWTMLVKGKHQYVPDLVTDAHAMLDQAMNEFARMDRFQVIFADENEEDAADDSN